MQDTGHSTAPNDRLRPGATTRTALHDAAARGDVTGLRELLEAGAEVTATDERGNRAIHEAAWAGHVEAVELLVRAGARLESSGWLGRTPLHAACRSPHDTRQLIRWLIAAGVDVNHRDDAEKTPIFRCCEAIEEFADKIGEEVFLDNARTLLAAGALPDFLDRHRESARDHTSRSSMHDLLGRTTGKTRRRGEEQPWELAKNSPGATGNRVIKRILYFDIDGVLLGYDECPKRALMDGVLEQQFKACRFTRFLCVSGWPKIIRNAHPNASLEFHLGQLYRRIAGGRPNGAPWSPAADGQHPLLPDANWFLSRLELMGDCHRRCDTIDLSADWWYVDDFAAEHFSSAHGHDLLKRHLGTRVFQTNPEGDGTDLLAWLEQVVMPGLS